MSNNTLYRESKKLEFCYKRYNKKMQVYQRFDVDVVPLVGNSVKKETTAQVFSHEFWTII